MHHTCILLYVISDLLLKVEYFVESAGVRYLRTGCRLKQRCLQKLKNECVNAVQSTFHWHCVYYVPIETFNIFPAFYTKSLWKPKMPKYAATHREMTKKTKEWSNINFFQNVRPNKIEQIGLKW